MQEAVTARIRCGWKKFIASVLGKKAESLKMRGGMNKSCVRRPLCYDAECWALRKENERKLQTTERRMLRIMCGKTLRDGISNQTICDLTGVKI